ncbi:MAG: methyltransferase domain-containing protein [Sphingobacteriaceae bacterium]|nr:methyltransferase domain-containing protein [Sphingobacteriaceae bacterium]
MGIKEIILKSYRLFKKTFKKIKSIEYLFYLGNNYSCPVCVIKLKKFKTYGGSYSIKGQNIDHTTPNYSCPKCGSGIRHRLIMAFLKQNHDKLLSGRRKILHFAPEKYITNFFNHYSNIEYIQADIDPTKFKNAIKQDITNITLPLNSIDGIICIHVLEHIYEDLIAIQQLNKVLKPGGWLLLVLPIYGDVTFEIPNLTAKEREVQYGIDEHMRLNGLDITRKLEDEGFEVTVISTENIVGDYFDKKIKTPHSESDKYLFYCTKVK